MCHTMCALGDGRLILLGGRRKEGICKVSLLVVLRLLYYLVLQDAIVLLISRTLCIA